jgi:alpha-1,4-digalacturonate transport system permease protein
MSKLQTITDAANKNSWTGLSGKKPPGVGTILRTLILIWMVILVVLPVIWIILASFKDLTELGQKPPTLYPHDWYFSNYTDALKTYGFATFFRNSVFVTFGATALTLLINSMAAFAFAKYNFRGREGLFIMTLAMLMIPLQVILIPIYQVITKLHMVNNFWGLIIPAAATPTGVFILRQYMLTIPDEIIESARLDGAGDFRIFLRIILPLAKPALAVVTIFSIMWRWNDFLWPLIVAQDSKYYTLPVALAILNGQLSVPYNLVLAMSVLSLLPVIIMFIFMQRQIAQGIAQTGIK